MAKNNRKKALRREMTARRRQLSSAARREASDAICDRIARAPFFSSARSIAVYSAVRGEVDLAPLRRFAVRAGKRVFLPVLLGGSRRIMRFAELRGATPLVHNRFGIPEPAPGRRIYAPPRTLDLVLTPVVAFDRFGNRLGLGAGYYDRCFGYLRSRGSWRRPKLVGVAYSFQETAAIEPDPWDVPLWRIVTELAMRRPAETTTTAASTDEDDA